MDEKLLAHKMLRDLLAKKPTIMLKIRDFEKIQNAPYDFMTTHFRVDVKYHFLAVEVWNEYHKVINSPLWQSMHG